MECARLLNNKWWRVLQPVPIYSMFIWFLTYSVWCKVGYHSPTQLQHPNTKTKHTPMFELLGFLWELEQHRHILRHTEPQGTVLLQGLRNKAGPSCRAATSTPLWWGAHVPAGRDLVTYRSRLCLSTRQHPEEAGQVSITDPVSVGTFYSEEKYSFLCVRRSEQTSHTEPSSSGFLDCIPQHKSWQPVKDSL